MRGVPGVVAVRGVLGVVLVPGVADSSSAEELPFRSEPLSFNGAGCGRRIMPTTLSTSLSSGLMCPFPFVYDPLRLLLRGKFVVSMAPLSSVASSDTLNLLILSRLLLLLLLLLFIFSRLKPALLLHDDDDDA